MYEIDALDRSLGFNVVARVESCCTDNIPIRLPSHIFDGRTLFFRTPAILPALPSNFAKRMKMAQVF